MSYFEPWLVFAIIAAVVISIAMLSSFYEQVSLIKQWWLVGGLAFHHGFFWTNISSYFGINRASCKMNSFCNCVQGAPTDLC